jgi:hypothetical protein
MEPRQPIGPLSALTLLAFAGLMLLAGFSAADGPGRRGPAGLGAASLQATSLHSLPPIPFGR